MTNKLKKEIEINEVRCLKCNSIIDLSTRDERIREQSLSTQKQEDDEKIKELKHNLEQANLMLNDKSFMLDRIKYLDSLPK